MRNYQMTLLEKKIREATFTLEDFLTQMRQIKKMGPISQLIGMIPGMGAELKNIQIDDKQVNRVEAIVLSMTPLERRKPEIINASRKKRIAAGSGMQVQDVNRLLKQFEDMKKMMKQLKNNKRFKF